MRGQSTRGAAILVACHLLSCDSGASDSDLCAGLDEGACGTTAGCAPVRGRESASEAQFLGCSTSEGCKQARLSLTHPETGKCWAIATTCLPGPWSKAAACDGASAVCKGLDEAACQVDPWCAPITGSLGYAGCWTALTEDGSAWTCGGAATTCSHPATGESWTFPSTCIPDGWDESTCNL
ncbi:MAG: hypothetical protein AMXMBFR64_36470 [Myxococcales bacterium]